MSLVLNYINLINGS